MTPLESLRQKLDEAYSAAIAADDLYGTATDIKHALADLLADCAVRVREEAEALNESDRIADERHYRAPLGCGSFGRV